MYFIAILECSFILPVTIVVISYTVSLQLCNGTANATHMECWTPAFPEEMADEKSDTGQIFIHMDGQSHIWESRFDYHPNVKIIPFENEDKLLVLKPGETEVSLHVCLQIFYLILLTNCAIKFSV